MPWGFRACLRTADQSTPDNAQSAHSISEVQELSVNASSLLYPMFAMVVLTALVLVTLFRRRVREVRDGRVSTRYFRIYQGELEPEAAAKAARHFSNLFEAPVLFYVACLAAMILRLDGWILPALAWAYVLARLLHAAVHLGGNRLRQRIAIYAISWLLLLGLWIAILVGVGLRAG
jgi:hypothetical protein